MKNTQKFIKFLESMKVHNPALVEAVTIGFNICFESEIEFFDIDGYEDSDDEIASQNAWETRNQQLDTFSNAIGCINELRNIMPEIPVVELIEIIKKLQNLRSQYLEQ